MYYITSCNKDKADDKNTLSSQFFRMSLRKKVQEKVSSSEMQTNENINSRINH